MSQAVFVQDGEAVDYTPGSDVVAGQVVVQGDLVGVAKSPISANVLGSLSVSGVFDFAKATGGGSAITVGTILYWDDSANVATATSTSNKLLGKCVKAAADADTAVRARLMQ